MPLRSFCRSKIFGEALRAPTHNLLELRSGAPCPGAVTQVWKSSCFSLDRAFGFRRLPSLPRTSTTYTMIQLQWPPRRAPGPLPRRPACLSHYQTWFSHPSKLTYANAHCRFCGNAASMLWYLSWSRPRPSTRYHRHSALWRVRVRVFSRNEALYFKFNLIRPI